MAASLARPKRAAEEFTRTRHNDNDAYKRPKFDPRNPSALAPDALEEDPVLDADEIGRRGQQVRRGAVNLDGYDSDSENEGFFARIEAKAKRSRQTHDAEDDDIFAQLTEDLEPEEIDADEALRKNKKNVRFLSDKDIEGQVESSRGGGKLHADLSRPEDGVQVEEVDSESDVADEERARLEPGMDEELGAGSKKKHAPLLDAFNMRAEREEGEFDDQGNYIRKAIDPDAAYDNWLEGVSKKDIRRAKEAAEQREAERKMKSLQDDSVLTTDILRTLITHLQRGETVLEALARLGKGLHRKPKWQTKQRNKHRLKLGEAVAEDIEMTEDNPEEIARRNTIEDVTGAADLLMSRGQLEIYDTEREILTRQYRQVTREEWVDPVSESAGTDLLRTDEIGPTMWLYRWSDARDGGDIHGPYDGSTMEAWRQAGYFQEGVEFRRVGDTGDWFSDVNFLH